MGSKRELEEIIKKVIKTIKENWEYLKSILGEGYYVDNIQYDYIRSPDGKAEGLVIGKKVGEKNLLLEVYYKGKLDLELIDDKVCIPLRKKITYNKEGGWGAGAKKGVPRNLKQLFEAVKKCEDSEILQLYDELKPKIKNIDGEEYLELGDKNNPKEISENLLKLGKLKIEYGEYISQKRKIRKREIDKKRTDKRSDNIADILKRKYGPGGEGKEHKKLKDYILKHPEEIGLINVKGREKEYIFPSGDAVDILFELDGNKYAVVEIETSNSDIMAGAYQALKYKVLKCAELKEDINSPQVKAFLVAPSIPQDVKEFCNMYGIKCREIKLK